MGEGEREVNRSGKLWIGSVLSCPENLCQHGQEKMKVGDSRKLNKMAELNIQESFSECDTAETRKWARRKEGETE